MEFPILTEKEARKILNAKGIVKVSLDLGISQEEVLVENGFAVIRKEKIPLKDFEKIREKMCYFADDGKLKQVALFSPETNFYYKLLPTSGWPTITLSSTPMHRFTFISPKEDTSTKIAEIKPVKGVVLDTCCGLGYTAIMASRAAEKVYCFERDSNVLTVAGFNPYSQELFSNPKIELCQQDISAGIRKFKDGFFDRIIHDPPTFKYSPELYSLKFYSELFRVLKKGGILYHYAPCPKKTKGAKFYLGIIKRLEEAGFSNAEYHERSSGVRAVRH